MKEYGTMDSQESTMPKAPGRWVRDKAGKGEQLPRKALSRLAGGKFGRALDLTVKNGYCPGS